MTRADETDDPSDPEGRDADAHADADHFRRWAAGDAEAGAALIRRHYRSVFLFFFSKVGAAPAEDLTQSTFEALCEKKLSFRGDATVRTYLFGIARWKLVHFHRRAHARRESFDPATDPLELPDVVSSMTSRLGMRQEEVLLVQGLRALAFDDQTILELRYYDGLSVRDLAAVFELPRATMADRLRRARERLSAAVKSISANARLVDSTLTGLDAHMKSVRAQVLTELDRG